MEHQIVKYLDPNEQRVLQENIDLEEKIIHLEEFINTNDTFKNMEFIDKHLLNAQLESMKSYSTILHARIQRFLDKKEVKK